MKREVFFKFVKTLMVALMFFANTGYNIIAEDTTENTIENTIEEIIEETIEETNEVLDQEYNFSSTRITAHSDYNFELIISEINNDKITNLVDDNTVYYYAYNIELINNQDKINLKHHFDGLAGDETSIKLYQYTNQALNELGTFGVGSEVSFDINNSGIYVLTYQSNKAQENEIIAPSDNEILDDETIIEEILDDANNEIKTLEVTNENIIGYIEPKFIATVLENAEVYYVITNTRLQTVTVNGQQKKVRGEIVAEGEVTTDLQSVRIPLINNADGTNWNKTYKLNFFIRSKENYMITGLGATGDNLMYTIDKAISNPDSCGPAQFLPTEKAEWAKAQKYVATFGYTLNANSGNNRFEVVLRAEQPTINNNLSIKRVDESGQEINAPLTLGEVIKLKVEVKPGEISDKNIQLVSNLDSDNPPKLYIQGMSHEIGDINDGVGYTTYTVTKDDIEKGSIYVSLEATFDYEITKRLTNTSFTTSSIITNSSEYIIVDLVENPIKNSINYYFGYEGHERLDFSHAPDGIKQLPVDTNSYEVGESVQVKSELRQDSTFVDEYNGGTWFFKGWKLNGQNVGLWNDENISFNMPDSNVNITGIWTFKANNSNIIYHSNYEGDDRTLTVDGVIGEKKIIKDGAIFPRDRYRIIGWSLTPDDDHVDVEVNSDYRLVNGGINLYAIWENDTIVVNVAGGVTNVNYDGNKHQATGFTVTLDDISKNDDGFSGDDFNSRFTFKYGGQLSENLFISSVNATNGTMRYPLNKNLFTVEDRDGVVKKVIVNSASDIELTVNKLDVMVDIKGNYLESTFDNTNHQVSGFKATITGGNNLFTENNITFNGTNLINRKDAGITYMGLTKEKFGTNSTNFNVTFNEVVDGYISIEKLPIKVKAIGNRETFTYDANEHIVSSYTLSVIEGDSLNIYSTSNVSYNGTIPSVKAIDVKYNDNNEVVAYPLVIDSSKLVNNDPNFEVAFEADDGSLLINPINDEVVVTITGEHLHVKYEEGTTHTISGYNITNISNSLYKNEYFTNIDNKNYEISREAIGRTDMNILASDFRNNNKNFTNVRFNIVDGHIVIEPQDAVIVKIIGESKTELYNGENHSFSTKPYEVEIEGNDSYVESNFIFVGNDLVQRVNAGSYEYDLTTDMFVNTNHSFDNVSFVIVNDATMEITPANVSVKAKGKNESVTYDKNNHVLSGYDLSVSGQSANIFDLNSISYNGTVPSVSAKDVKYGGNNEVLAYDLNLDKDLFVNNNPNYNVSFEVEKGSLTINPYSNLVTVSIKGVHVHETYNGQEFTATGFNVSSSTDLYGAEDMIVPHQDYYKITNHKIGDYYMNISPADFSNKNNNFNNVQFVVADDGHLKINEAETVIVKVRGNHEDRHIYDGTEQTLVGQYEFIESSNPNFTSDMIVFKGKEVKRTDAGTTKLGLVASDFSVKEGIEFKADFVIVEDGYLQINKQPINIKAIGTKREAIYNGTTHTIEGYELELPEGSTFNKANITYDGAIPSVSAKDVMMDNDGNIIAYPLIIDKSKLKNADSNYEVNFSVEDGSLKINPYHEEIIVSISGNHNHVIYDGSNHQAVGYEITNISNSLYTINDFDKPSQSDISASGTLVGEYLLKYKEEEYFSNDNHGFENINKNFNNIKFLVTNGHLVINQPGTFIVTIEGKTLDPIEYDSLDHKLVPNGNYQIKSITRPTPTAPHGVNEDIYDGLNVDASGIRLKEDVKAKTIKNAAVYKFGLKASDFEYIGENQESVNIDFVIYKDIEQTITKKDYKIYIRGDKVEKEYDGQVHEAIGFQAFKTEKEADDYKLLKDIRYEGTLPSISSTNVCDLPLVLDQAKFKNENQNYNVTFDVEDGYLKVTPHDDSINVAVNSVQQVFNYSGNEIVGGKYSFSIPKDSVLKEEDIIFDNNKEWYAKGTEVNNYQTKLHPSHFKTNNNFSNVTFEVNNAEDSMVIKPANVVLNVVGKQEEYIYNGKAQSAQGYDVEIISDPTNKFTVDDIVYDGDNPILESTNITDGKQMMNLDVTKFGVNNANYQPTFNVTDGYLEVKPYSEDIWVSVIGVREEYEYTGDVIKGGNYDFEIIDLDTPLTKEDIKPINLEDDSWKASGIDVGEYPINSLKDLFMNTNPNITNVYFKDGDEVRIKINPSPVVIEINANTKEVMYDGNENVLSGYQAVVKDNSDKTNKFNLDSIYYDGIEPSVKRTQVGTSELIYEEDSFKCRDINYDVTFVINNGYLKVNQRQAVSNDNKDETIKNENILTTYRPVIKNDIKDIVVTIKANSLKEIYDGKIKTLSGYTYSSTDVNYSDKDFSYNGTNIIIEESEVGEYRLSFNSQDFENHNKNYNVKFVVEDGSLTIEKQNSLINFEKIDDDIGGWGITSLIAIVLILMEMIYIIMKKTHNNVIKKIVINILSIAIGFIAAVLFVMNEDLSKTMVIIDGITIICYTILLVQTCILIYTSTTKSEKE